MDWHKLLLTSERDESKNKGIRSKFRRDIDRIIFSLYFRKLQDKTQVYPLSKSSIVRTRLTHSLEVASIGKSLGFAIGEYLKNDLPEGIGIQEISDIVEASCLCHDIGNPPFGHKAEMVINDFFKEFFALNKDLDILEEEKLTFTEFDGNAQGLRIINSLDTSLEKTNSLNLTAPIVATFCKYPSSIIEPELSISSKKIGLFKNDVIAFKTTADILGLKVLKKDKVWARHPLTFLMEAADDIAYIFADIEDTYSAGNLSLKDVEDFLEPFITKKPYSYKHLESHEKIMTLKSSCINNLIHSVVTAYTAALALILDGNFNEEILYSSYCDYSEKITICKKESQKIIFSTENKLVQEYLGCENLKYILEIFSECILDIKKNKNFLRTRLINSIFLNGKLSKEKSYYDNFLAVIDFISSSTDQNILDYSQKLRSIIN